LASDEVDGDISSTITTSGSVDACTTRTYTLTYSVSDAAGNSAELTRTIIVAVATIFTDNTQYDSNDSDRIEEGQITLYSVSGKTLTKLVDYAVEDGLLEYQQDTAKHEEICEQVVKISPASYVEKMNQLVIYVGDYNDSYSLYGSLAYVLPTSDDLSTWQYAIAIDLAYQVTFGETTSGLNGTIVHELGHILTLDSTQIDSFTSSEECSTYHLEEGCSRKGTYIYSFSPRFLG